MNIYQLLQVCYMHGRRYPRFEVYTEQVIIATSLEKAEEGMRKHIEKGCRLDNIYAFYIREIPVDCPAVGAECLSERVYDASGRMLDRRLFSSIPEERELFNGRKQEDLRFRPGDIVEVLDCEQVRLGVLTAVPTSPSRANEINSTGLLQLDETDDSYTVYLEPDYKSHTYADALRVFAPHSQVPEPTLRKIKKAYLKMTINQDYTSALEDDWEGTFLFVSRGKSHGVIVKETGEVVVPCICDQVLERIDIDGVMPFRIGEKWGLFSVPGGLYVPAKYDQIVVASEEYVKVLFNGTWGWLDSDGHFTTDQSRAAIGSWENHEK